MQNKPGLVRQPLPRGVIFNAYPDSIGSKLADILAMLRRPAFRGVFSHFYILPTFFNSDLDRGFSIIDYDLNRDLVSNKDLDSLQDQNISLKLDLVLNHLSVNSPQFQALLSKAQVSGHENFFIDWNRFWQGRATIGDDGCAVPEPESLRNLFTRKPGLPVMKVRFPDGSNRFFWNTFYQEICYDESSPQDYAAIPGINPGAAEAIAALINKEISAGVSPAQVKLGPHSAYSKQILSILEQKRRYRGQIDLDARSPEVWAFYDATLRKLRDYGTKIVRLDAFAYLHKEPGLKNFFNRPGTWDYLERLKEMALKYDLAVLPEIHAEYGSGLHAEISEKGYPFYDFFFPGLVIDALERSTTRHLISWIKEIMANGYDTINMLGCHDGIPVLDLRGAPAVEGGKAGLLSDQEINALINLITARGGLIKNLYGPNGKKISYYQVNATFFSALGEDERKLRLARAIQIFMPGIPQIWYLDLFAGRNDYAAAEKGGAAGHKEINRTNLSLEELECTVRKPIVIDQLEMIRLRNSSPAFNGSLEIADCPASHLLQLTWRNKGYVATLSANLLDYSFSIEYRIGQSCEELLKYS